jgi:hypothetical protein
MEDNQILILCGFKSLLINWSTGIMLPKNKIRERSATRNLKVF